LAILKCKIKITIQIAILMETTFQGLQMIGQQWLTAVDYYRDIPRDFHPILIIKIFFLDSSL
jgi:hypothetical protein